MDTRARNRLMTLKGAQPDQDEMGHPSGDRPYIATLWANVMHLRGVESIKAGAETAITRVSINVGFRSGLTAGMELSDAGGTYQIEEVLPDVTRKSGIDLVCTVINPTT